MTGDETPPLPKESERAWWNEDEWEKRERRSILSSNPSRTERRRELENTVKTALRELDRMDRMDRDEVEIDKDEGSGEQSEQEEFPRFDRFFTSELHSDSLLPPRRKRSEDVLAEKNSGTAKDILGTTIALDCHDKREDPQAGFQPVCGVIPSIFLLRYSLRSNQRIGRPIPLRSQLQTKSSIGTP
ncbi:hypothetical protein Y032_0035g3048 [Ancylostoma ceylanicum]|nr:hypothetical protein Y032_0035g3048 [Ancylostoma ceylanicum]